MRISDSFLSFLRAERLRITSERNAIASAAESLSGPFNAEKLLAKSRAIDRHVSRATVYRTFGLLVESGLFKIFDSLKEGARIIAAGSEADSVSPELASESAAALGDELVKSVRVRAVRKVQAPSEKFCALCGDVKPSAAFYPRSVEADRLDPMCRTCRDERIRKLKEGFGAGGGVNLQPMIRAKQSMRRDAIQWHIPAAIAELGLNPTYSRTGRLSLGTNWGCMNCRVVKPVDEYFLVKGNPNSYCRQCVREKVAERRQTNAGRSYLADYNSRVSTKRRIKAWQSSAKGHCTIIATTAKKRAAEGGVPFSISQRALLGIYPAEGTRCPLLPQLVLDRGTGKATESSISLDRLVPSKGYVLRNLIFCSTRANMLKGEFSVQELLAAAKDCASPAVAVAAKAEAHPMWKVHGPIRVRAKIDSALARGIHVDEALRAMSDDEIAAQIFFPRFCPFFDRYLGVKLELSMEPGPLVPETCSFDRIDPKKGYTLENIRVISWHANRLKKNGTEEEFRTIAENLRRIMEERHLA